MHSQSVCTPLHWVSWAEYRAIAQLLPDTGASVAAADECLQSTVFFCRGQLAPGHTSNATVISSAISQEVVFFATERVNVLNGVLHVVLLTGTCAYNELSTLQGVYYHPTDCIQ